MIFAKATFLDLLLELTLNHTIIPILQMGTQKHHSASQGQDEIESSFNF